jgi:CRAL/TRIO domain
MDYCPSAILHGLDHDGDPIYLERAGATDAASLLTHFGHKALIRHVIWLRELCGRGAWITNHEQRMGRPITQVTIVYDLEGLNMRHLRPGVLPLFAHMMRLTQDNYTGPVKVG